MSNGRNSARSPYMEWAKLQSGAKYNLATSGIANFPLAGLDGKTDGLEINGPDAYGYVPLLERLARMNGVDPAWVVTAAGTSMANHLAMAACFEPGEEVLVEDPTYELLTSALQYLGAKIHSFQRQFENGYRIDPAEVRRAMTARTKLIVITNMHNPSGVLTDEATLRAIGDIAAENGASVLVDEVYLEGLFEKRPRPACHLGKHFVVTSSLTKAFGLSGLRCGWVLAEPELAERMWHINDLHGATGPFPAEVLSVLAIDQLEKPIERAKKILATNRPELDKFLDAQDRIEAARPEFGTIVFPRLKRGNVDEFDRFAREKYQTAIVPGRFFGQPQHFRIGIGGEEEMTKEGLSRLGRALEEFVIGNL